MFTKSAVDDFVSNGYPHKLFFWISLFVFQALVIHSLLIFYTDLKPLKSEFLLFFDSLYGLIKAYFKYFNGWVYVFCN